jgi:hypothetical protein
MSRICAWCDSGKIWRYSCESITALWSEPLSCTLLSSKKRTWVGWEAFLGFRWVDMGVWERKHKWRLSLLQFHYLFACVLALFSTSRTFRSQVLGRQPHLFQPQSARYALIMQDNSEQQYPTNPMDSPPELSQSSCSYMGLEGDADPR